MQDVLSWLENHESQEQLYFMSGVFCSILGPQYMFIFTMVFIFKKNLWDTFISPHVHTHVWQSCFVLGGITVKLEWNFFPFVSMKPRVLAGTLRQILLIDMSLKKTTHFQSAIIFVSFLSRQKKKKAFKTGFIYIVSTTNLFQTLLIPQSNSTIFSDIILPVPATYSK